MSSLRSTACTRAATQTARRSASLLTVRAFSRRLNARYNVLIPGLCSTPDRPPAPRLARLVHDCPAQLARDPGRAQGAEARGHQRHGQGQEQLCHARRAEEGQGRSGRGQGCSGRGQGIDEFRVSQGSFLSLVPRDISGLACPRRHCTFLPLRPHGLLDRCRYLPCRSNFHIRRTEYHQVVLSSFAK